MKIVQKSITLEERKRGFNIITNEIIENLPELINFRSGLLNIFLQHTSASLSINENASYDVRTDLENHFNRSVPEKRSLYEHTLEGSDDMPAHIKSTSIGVSLNIPVTSGKLALGTWQGIYLCEHRDYGGRRKIILTLTGEEK